MPRALVDDRRRAVCRGNQFPVTAEEVLGGIIDDSSRNWVEVDVTYDLAKAIIGVDHPRAVPALPKASKIPVTFVVFARNRPLKARHRPPQIDISGFENKVIVVVH